jgi:hypothetical protein
MFDLVPVRDDAPAGASEPLSDRVRPLLGVWSAHAP